MTKKKFNRKRIIRYSRWTIKLAFLFFFVSPFIYLAGAPNHYVYSIFFGGLKSPLLALPYGQSVCSIWIIAYGKIGPGAWLIDPFGGLQILLTRQVYMVNILPIIAALLLFLFPIFVLGNVFCGWVCPLGAAIDGFDKVVSTFLRTVEGKREERFRRSKEKEATKTSSKLNTAVCPTCPLSRLLNNRFGGTAANGVLLTSLVGSAIFRFPVFCAICPIGISTRGMFNLKALTFMIHTNMPIILELWAIPLVAVLASLREKRYWCRKICPVGATLNVAGSVSPLMKPTVIADRCIMKMCPKMCEDYRFDYCGTCRVVDAKKCERVCPQGINLMDCGSLAKCTRCMECYIECDNNAVTVDVRGKSEAGTALKEFFKRKPKTKGSAKQT